MGLPVTGPVMGFLVTDPVGVSRLQTLPALRYVREVGVPLAQDHRTQHIAALPQRSQVV